MGDPELKTRKEGDIVKIHRRGFYRIDRAYDPSSSGNEQAVGLIKIPDGSEREGTLFADLCKNEALSEEAELELFGEVVKNKRRQFGCVKSILSKNSATVLGFDLRERTCFFAENFNKKVTEMAVMALNRLREIEISII